MVSLSLVKDGFFGFGVFFALPNLKCSFVVQKKKKNAKCQNAKVEAP